jgi:hypothetical protein
MTRSRLSFCSELGALAFFTALAISPSHSQAISLGQAAHYQGVCYQSDFHQSDFRQRACQELARDITLSPPSGTATGTQHKSQDRNQNRTSNERRHVHPSHVPSSIPFPHFPFIPPIGQDRTPQDWTRRDWRPEWWSLDPPRFPTPFGFPPKTLGRGRGLGRCPDKAQPCAITPEPSSVLQITTGLILLAIFRSAFRSTSRSAFHHRSNRQRTNNKIAASA